MPLALEIQRRLGKLNNVGKKDQGIADASAISSKRDALSVSLKESRSEEDKARCLSNIAETYVADGMHSFALHAFIRASQILTTCASKQSTSTKVQL